MKCVLLDLININFTYGINLALLTLLINHKGTVARISVANKLCLIMFHQIIFRDRTVGRPNCEQYFQVQEFFSCFQNLRNLGEVRAEK